MANSYVEYTTAGSGTNGLGQTTFTAPSKFLSINDIRAKGYNGSTWTELTVSSRGTTTVTLSATPTAGSYSKVRIYRATTSQQIIDFQAGARLAESDLDTAYNQGLYVAQEVSEDAGAVGSTSTTNLSLSGTTSVDNLTATGTVTLPNSSISNDNLAGSIANDKLAGSIAANKLAGGIDLTTQITGYQTGTFTPVAELFSGTVTFSNAIYTRIGNIVHYSFKISNKSNTSDNSQIRIGGFPFTMVGEHPASVGVNSSSLGHAMVLSGKMFFYSPTGGDFTYDNLAHTSGYIRVQGSYFIS